MSVAMRRVVVTGMGIACPLGLGVENVWKRLVAGESGINAIQSFDTSELTAKIAGQVPIGTRAEGKLDISEWIPVKDQKKMDRFIHLALVAASEAVEDSGWVPPDEDARCATGVMIGSGIGGLGMIYEASVLVAQGKFSLIGAAIAESPETTSEVRLGQERGGATLEIRALRFPVASGRNQLLRAFLVFEDVAAA